MAEITTQQLYDWIVKNWSGKLALKPVDVLPARGLHNTVYLVKEYSSFHFWDGGKFISIGGAAEATMFADRHQSVNSVVERNEIALKDRAVGKLVSYVNADFEAVTARFDGSDVTEAQWTNENNWTTITGSSGTTSSINAGLYKGKYDASTGILPSQLLEGEYLIVETAGILEGLTPIYELAPGDIVQATTDNPTDISALVSYRGFGTYTQIAKEMQSRAKVEDSRFLTIDEKKAAAQADAPSETNPFVTKSGLAKSPGHGYVGKFDPNNGYPSAGTGESGTIKKGNSFRSQYTTSLEGLGLLYQGDFITALKDRPGTGQSSWGIVRGSIVSELASGRLYIDQNKGNDANDGKTELTALNSIEKGISSLTELGGPKGIRELYIIGDYSWDTASAQIPEGLSITASPESLLTIGSDDFPTVIEFNGRNELNVIELQFKRVICIFYTGDKSSKLNVDQLKVSNESQVIFDKQAEVQTKLIANPDTEPASPGNFAQINIKRYFDIKSIEDQLPSCTFYFSEVQAEFNVNNIHRSDANSLLHLSKYCQVNADLGNVTMDSKNNWSSLIKFSGPAKLNLTSKDIEAVHLYNSTSVDPELNLHVNNLNVAELSPDASEKISFNVSALNYKGYRLPLPAFMEINASSDALKIPEELRKEGMIFTVRGTHSLYTFIGGTGISNLIEHKLPLVASRSNASIDLYIDPENGQDIPENGDLGRPLKSLQYACSILQGLNNSSIRFRLLRGKYDLSTGLEIAGEGNRIELIGELYTAIASGISLTQDLQNKHKYEVFHEGTFSDGELEGLFLRETKSGAVHPIYGNTGNILHSNAEAINCSEIIAWDTLTTLPASESLFKVSDSNKVSLKRMYLGLSQTPTVHDPYITRFIDCGYMLPDQEVGIDFRICTYQFENSVIWYYSNSSNGTAIKIRSVDSRVTSFLNNSVIVAPTPYPDSTAIEVGNNCKLPVGNHAISHFSIGVKLMSKTSEVQYDFSNAHVQDLGTIHQVEFGGCIMASPGKSAKLYIENVGSYLTATGDKDLTSDLKVLLPEDLIPVGSFSVFPFVGIPGFYFPERGIIMTGSIIPRTIATIQKVIADGMAVQEKIGYSAVSPEIIVEYLFNRKGKKESAKYILHIDGKGVVTYEVYKSFNSDLPVYCNVGFAVSSGLVFMNIHPEPIGEDLTIDVTVIRKFDFTIIPGDSPSDPIVQ